MVSGNFFSKRARWCWKVEIQYDMIEIYLHYEVYMYINRL